MKLLSLFRALTHRSFALLWTGQTISSLGGSIYQVALVWWVLIHTGSALAMGAVLIGLIWVNAIQEKVPRQLQGRVSSIDYLGSSLLGPAGYLVGGWVTPWLGLALVFVIGGAPNGIDWRRLAAP